MFLRFETKLIILYAICLALRRQEVPWDLIMENEFEYLSDRGGHCVHLAESF